MSLYDRFKNLVNPVDTDDEYDDNNEYVFDEQEPAQYSEPEYQTAQEQTVSQPAQSAPRRPAPAMQNSVSVEGGDLEIKVVYPEKWESVNVIADHLIKQRTVVVNLEKTNKELSRRMIDFLFGVVYTIKGDIKKVAANTWLVTPVNVTLSQEQSARSSKSPDNDGFDDNF